MLIKTESQRKPERVWLCEWGERVNGFLILLKPCAKYSANQSDQILLHRNL